jgi:integrase
MPKRRRLTDPGIAALKPAKPGQRYDLMDSLIPQFGIRVTDKGHKSFFLLARFPDSPNGYPTRRTINKATLGAARAKAKEWLDWIGDGFDPAEREAEAKRAEQRKRANSFAAVCEDFIKEKLPTERKGKEIEQDLRRVFMGPLGSLPITEIVPEQVVRIVKAKKAEGAPAQARNLLGTVKRMFSWAVEQHAYFDSKTTLSPLAGLRPTAIVGEKLHRDRVLDDDEIFALWRAVRREGYPWGPAYQLLLLTALRLNEVVDASWPEFDLRGGVWVIPAQRMKGKDSRARAHAVPITPQISGILERLPRFPDGRFLFSTLFGKSPIWMGHRVKQRLDARMLRTLRALARRREDTKPKELRPWVNHDIRRTVRTRLSRLKISEEAREAVLAHARPGIKGVYDVYEYFDEKREALELWAARLRDIVTPAPANVVTLHKTA